jgi:hypothetical protein
MDRNEIEEFALKLMQEVWEPYNDKKVKDFYHFDVVGYHRDQVIHLGDVENRLRWDKKNLADPDYKIENLVVGDNEFSIHFNYTAREIKTGEMFQAEVMYFYRLEDDLIRWFWTLASVNFDYLERA